MLRSGTSQSDRRPGINQRCSVGRRRIWLHAIVVLWVWELYTSGWGKLGGERVQVLADKGRERFAQVRGSAVSV